jgi:hypothetical protein
MSIFTGIKQLLESPSGTFALICFAGMLWKASAIGAPPFVAFFSIAIALLTWVEHKETMAQINSDLLSQANTLANPPIVPDKGTPG